jgi:hypothetical protein
LKENKQPFFLIFSNYFLFLLLKAIENICFVFTSVFYTFRKMSRTHQRVVITAISEDVNGLFFVFNQLYYSYIIKELFVNLFFNRFTLIFYYIDV